MLKKIFIIDDDELFADCVARNIEREFRNTDSISPNIEKFKNAIDAMNSLSNDLPDMIFLDVLLPGPDGFTFLNELASYPDTSKIPVVLLTSLELPDFDLKNYGVIGILNKEKMKPKDIAYYVKRYQN